MGSRLMGLWSVRIVTGVAVAAVIHVAIKRRSSFFRWIPGLSKEEINLEPKGKVSEDGESEWEEYEEWAEDFEGQDEESAIYQEGVRVLIKKNGAFKGEVGIIIGIKPNGLFKTMLQGKFKTIDLTTEEMEPVNKAGSIGLPQKMKKLVKKRRRRIMVNVDIGPSYKDSVPEESLPPNEIVIARFNLLRGFQFAKDGLDSNMDDSDVLRWASAFTCTKEGKVLTEAERDEMTCRLYGDMLRWRREHNMDKSLLVKPKGWEEFNKIWKRGVCGRDRIGRPVFYDRLGSIDAKALLKLDFETVERCHFRCMEEIWHHKRYASAVGKRIYKHIHVCDLKNVGWAHIGAAFREVLRRVLSKDALYNVGCLGRLFVVNVPTMYRYVWSMVSGLLHATTLAKVEILGSGDAMIERLNLFIDREQIPRWLGGNNEQDEVGICLTQFGDIDYSSEPAKWKGRAFSVKGRPFVLSRVWSHDKSSDLKHAIEKENGREKLKKR